MSAYPYWAKKSIAWDQHYLLDGLGSEIESSISIVVLNTSPRYKAWFTFFMAQLTTFIA